MLYVQYHFHSILNLVLNVILIFSSGYQIHYFKLTTFLKDLIVIFIF